MKISFPVALISTVVSTFVVSAELPRPEVVRVEVNPSQLALEYPMGNLGYRVGTYLQIEGVREENGKAGTQTLRVDTINGEKISTLVSIWIENVKGGALPSGKRCVIRGYESARMIGLPNAVAKAENLPLRQALWQMQRYFIVTSVVEPKELEK
ncbi:MAG: hypothetical protein Q7J98_07675 [Kiritimatiellia bacterium]|nr:hypothetical protein [Kiritimatiellia bacterium]